MAIEQSVAIFHFITLARQALYPSADKPPLLKNQSENESEREVLHSVIFHSILSKNRLEY